MVPLPQEMESVLAAVPKEERPVSATEVPPCVSPVVGEMEEMKGGL